MRRGVRGREGGVGICSHRPRGKAGSRPVVSITPPLRCRGLGPRISPSSASPGRQRAPCRLPGRVEHIIRTRVKGGADDDSSKQTPCRVLCTTTLSPPLPPLPTSWGLSSLLRARGVVANTIRQQPRPQHAVTTTPLKQLSMRPCLECGFDRACLAGSRAVGLQILHRLLACLFAWSAITVYHYVSTAKSGFGKAGDNYL